MSTKKTEPKETATEKKEAVKPAREDYRKGLGAKEPSPARGSAQLAAENARLLAENEALRAEAEKSRAAGGEETVPDTVKAERIANEVNQREIPPADGAGKTDGKK